MIATAVSFDQLAGYSDFLRQRDRSTGTIEQYVRDVGAFLRFLDGRFLTSEHPAAWKAHLLHQGFAPATVNAMLSALNGFFVFLGREDCRVPFLKLQRRVFRDPGKELSRKEYEHLFRTAMRQGRERLALVMETICATGIRVSETAYITVEAARRGRAEVSLKGKIRTILIPRQLAQKLLSYARAKKIVSGEIFLTKNGRSLSRRQIWYEMKQLCAAAGVEASKVFPHNLRHLFAVVFYQASRDIVRLADILGHSSIETTRIYLVTSGEEHARQLEQLKLIF